MNYLLDTTIVIDMLKPNDKINNKIQEVINKGDTIFVDGMGYYETKRRLLRKKNNYYLLKELEKICKTHSVKLHDDCSILDKAAQNWADLKSMGALKKKTKKRKEDVDILIASNAMCRNYTLISYDKDFDWCEKLGLKRENWKS